MGAEYSCGGVWLDSGRLDEEKTIVYGWIHVPQDSWSGLSFISVIMEAVDEACSQAVKACDRNR